MTQTLHKNKIDERKDKEPIVIKHIEDDDKVILTVSRFN